MIELLGQAAYLFVGSASAGYILLRIGWPSTRGLNESYKAGWAIVIGALFAVVALIMAIVIAGFGIGNPLLASASLAFIISGIALSTKRKTIAKKRVRISIPKKIYVNKAEGKRKEKLLIASKKIPEHRARELRELLHEKSEKKKEEKEKDAEKNKTAEGIDNVLKNKKVVEKTKETEEKTENAKKENLSVVTESKKLSFVSKFRDGKEKETDKEEVVDKIEKEWSKLEKRGEKSKRKQAGAGSNLKTSLFGFLSRKKDDKKEVSEKKQLSEPETKTGQTAEKPEQKVSEEKKIQGKEKTETGYERLPRRFSSRQEKRMKEQKRRGQERKAEQKSESKISGTEKLKLALFGAHTKDFKKDNLEEQKSGEEGKESFKQDRGKEEETKTIGQILADQTLEESKPEKTHGAEAFKRIVEDKELELLEREKSISEKARLARQSVIESEKTEQELEETEKQEKEISEKRDEEVKKIMSKLKSISEKKKKPSKKKKKHTPRRLRRFKRAEGQEISEEQEDEISDALGSSMPRDSFKGTDLGEESEDLFEQIDSGKGERTRKLASEEYELFVSKHRRVPKGREYDEIASNLYDQIKDDGSGEEHGRGRRSRRDESLGEEEKEKTSRGRRSRSSRHGKRDEQENEEEPGEIKDIEDSDVGETGSMEDLSVKELLGADSGKDTANQAIEKSSNFEGGVPDFSEDLELKGLEDGVDNISEELETDKNSCPSCKSKTGELIFCFECGTGFCPHCATKAKKIGDITHYSCPKCGAEVKVRPKM